MQKAKRIISTIVAAVLMLSICAVQSGVLAASAPKIKKTTYNANKKTLSITWSKVKKAKGYQVRYSTKKNFKKAKNVVVKKAKATLKNIKSTTYIKVRSYKLKGKKKVYGKFGKVKKFVITKTQPVTQAPAPQAPTQAPAPQAPSQAPTTQTPQLETKTYSIKEVYEKSVVNGRTGFDSEDRLIFDWSGTSIKFRAKCAGRIVLTAGQHNGWGFIMVSVDGGEYQHYRLEWGANFGANTLNIAKDLPYGEHTIEIIKQTEASQCPSRLVSIRLDGELMDKPEDTTPNKMVFFGDSITSGVGIIGDSGSYQGNMDPIRTYAALTANEFNANYELVSIGGWGMVTDTGNNTSGNVVQFLPYVDFNKTVTKTYPDNDMDVAVVNLGQNDQCSITDFKTVATQFVADLRANYPNATIVLTTGMLGQKYKAQLEQIVAEATEAGDNNIMFVLLPFNNEGGEWGHPSAAGHRAAADVLIQALEGKVN